MAVGAWVPLFSCFGGREGRCWGSGRGSHAPVPVPVEGAGLRLPSATDHRLGAEPEFRGHACQQHVGDSGVFVSRQRRALASSPCRGSPGPRGHAPPQKRHRSPTFDGPGAAVLGVPVEWHISRAWLLLLLTLWVTVTGGQRSKQLLSGRRARTGLPGQRPPPPLPPPLPLPAGQLGTQVGQRPRLPRAGGPSHPRLLPLPGGDGPFGGVGGEPQRGRSRSSQVPARRPGSGPCGVRVRL